MAKEKEEPKQWTLTTDERLALKEFNNRAVGLSRILESLSLVEGNLFRQEQAWWEGVRLKHKIPNEARAKLVADWEAGKVWVRDEVPSLDNIPKFKP